MTNSRDTVRAYLANIGRTPLLTPIQEIEYSREIQKGKDYLEIPNDALSTQQLELKKKASHYLEKMMAANLRLVVCIAKKYRNSDFELLDRIQEGNLGLRTACLKFDPDRQCRFSTFAYWWIRQAITRALYMKSHSIRVPVHIQESYRKITKLCKQYFSNHSSVPSLEYIANELDFTEEKVKSILQAMRGTVSLNALARTDEDSSELLDFVSDSSQSPVSELEHNDLLLTLQRLLSTLTIRDQFILDAKFNLTGQYDCPQSLQKIADTMNPRCTRENIRQRLNKAIQHLKHLKEIGDLKELYLE
ncbi:MAG: sigma-70 family RNA polymerase sigma factor [Cyanobacteria bacterium J06621_8]